MIVSGRLLKAETVSGTSDSGPYSYLRAHILDGVEVISARVGDHYGPLPQEGQQIEAQVSVRAYRGREGARLAFTITEPVRSQAAQKSA